MKKLIIFYALWGLFISGSLSTEIVAQSGPEEIVSATLTSSATEVKPGESFTLSIKLNLIPDAHANSNSPADPNLIATVFSPDKTEGVEWGNIKYPQPTSVMVTYSVEQLSVFEDGAIISVPVTVASTFKENQLKVGGNLRIQVCDRMQCYPPKRIPLTVQLQINGGKSAQTNSVGQSRNTVTQQKSASGSNQVSDSVDFDFVDFTGKSRKISEYRGKFVLLDFWATWCRPCLADIPKLKVLYDKYQAGGFEIVGMDSETLSDDEEPSDPEFAKETGERAKQIVKTRGANWTHATAETAVPIAKKIFGVKALPTKILLDKDGKIIATIGEKDDLTGIVEKLINPAK